MLLISAILLAATPDLVTLSQKAQVKELCDALRAQPAADDRDPAQEVSARKEALARAEAAADRLYELEVPSKGFAFGRYREGDKLIELDGDRPLHAIDGMLSVDLDGIDEVAFEATPDQVTAWSAAKKAGTLRLVVVFKPSGDRCAGSAAAESWRIAGKPRSWKIVDENGIVASADSEGEPVTHGPRRLSVEKVSLESDQLAPDDEGKSRLASVRPLLERCATGAQRSGNLVLGFDVRQGRAQDPLVMLDSLRDDHIAACVARAVLGAVVGGSGHGTASISLQ
jgi:hypothetical protein